ncbi:MAG: diguanylate cyclase, partial [Gammaproteobacteria bacterium]|nr:diguanylate cyclase [Gammaproteobacteria bacterium]
TNDVIYGIEIDDNGELWLSTNYGISRFDPTSGEIHNIHRGDGLQSEEFNFGAHYRSAGGELFFGGSNGFNAFRPERVLANEQVPLIMLTGFFTLGQPIKSDLPIDEHEGIELSHSDSSVSFEFAAMDYAAPTQNQYMYKLEGFDKDWIDLGNRRRVTYTDLDDGQYLLRVKAANSSGVWNEAGFAMPVRVTPAPWDTWWAYTGYLAMIAQFVVFLWFSHKRKIRREEEYSNQLEIQVKQRTAEIAERNLELRNLNQSLQESSLSDPLTGLRNRRFVFEEVAKELDVIQRKHLDTQRGLDPNDASGLVFMMVDLDNFKPINDTYGHAAGDQILLEVRDLLLGTCRKSDFVIRWGGDEFVVIAKQSNPGEAEALAERIRSTIAEHTFAMDGGQVVRTTCSIGFAAYPVFSSPRDEDSLDQIINLADSLMYEAKKQRNAWAGMLGVSDAATSEGFNCGDLDATSLLFRAHREGNLRACRSSRDRRVLPGQYNTAG